MKVGRAAIIQVHQVEITIPILIEVWNSREVIFRVLRQ
jgi:hypothetical protein